MMPYGHQDPRPHERPALDDAVHHPREAEPEHEFDHDADDRDHRRRHEVVPPDRIGQHGDVVGEPDELLPLRVGESIAVERQHDRVDQRIGGDDDHHDERRSRQAEAEASLVTRSLRHRRLLAALSIVWRGSLRAGRRWSWRSWLVRRFRRSVTAGAPPGAPAPCRRRFPRVFPVRRRSPTGARCVAPTPRRRRSTG